MITPKANETYSDKEAKERFEAALRAQSTLRTSR
jgi:hypothetical protein